MVSTNITVLIGVFVAYLLLFAFIPFWLRGFKLAGEKTLDKLVSSFIFSHVVVVPCVLFLSLLGIYYRITLILLLVLVASAYRYFFKREETFKFFRAIISGIHDITGGYLKPQFIIKRIYNYNVSFIREMLLKIKSPVGLACTLAIFAVAAYIRCYHSIFGLPITVTTTTDIYTHTEWIKYLMSNVPFYFGVYPYGVHSVTAAVSTVFGINVVTVVRMLGSISGMMILISLYYVLRKILKSTFAVNIPIAIYALTDYFHYGATSRQSMLMPQEYGNIFLYFVGYFLYKYLTERKRKDLVLFAATIAVTLSCHFYITIFAAILCFWIFLFFIYRVNRKIFLRLVAGVVAGLLIGALPLIGGLAKGIPPEQSFAWAFNYIKGAELNVDEEDSEEVIVGEPTEDAEGAESVGTIDNKSLPTRFYDKFIEQTKDRGNWLEGIWSFPYLIVFGLALIVPFVALIFKASKEIRNRYFILAAFSMYSISLFILYLSASVEFFALTESLRLFMIFVYAVPFVFCIPIELIHTLIYKTKLVTKIIYALVISTLVGIGANYTVKEKRFMPVIGIYEMHYDGSVATYYKIVNEFPKNQWIIVSSVIEYPLILLNGYHYNVLDFVKQLDGYDHIGKPVVERTEEEEKEAEENLDIISLPAENIFVYIEKRPIKWWRHRDDDNPLALLNPNDSLRDLNDEFGKDEFGDTTNGGLLGSSRAYQDYECNRVLQAKMYAWAQEFQKFHNNEMSVFYEDDNLVVYRIKQDPYALLNFYIPYTNKGGGTA